MDDKKQNKSINAQREEKVLEFWKENNIFQKTLSKKDNQKGEFVFYEGPPTANGMPGIHHLEARAFKDAIPRYKTMQGYHVARKGGWDTHGLPVELQVEKKLGLNSKKAIEEYGIGKFNQECKESVWQYLDIWNDFTKRIGYWVDQENSYFTYDNSYIESVWNVLANVHKKDLLYKDYRIVPWCARCGTALSSHELAQGYEDVKDLSVTAKFHLLPGQKWGNGFETKDTVYILAWTTTPWTLFGNVALAVGGKILYTALRVEGVAELYILAKELVPVVFKDQKIEIVHDDILGSDLVGLEYEPLYPQAAEYIKEQTSEDKFKNAYKVYDADFVTTSDGTGVVHTAVMYGADDFDLGTKINLPKVHLVDLSGKYVDGIDNFSGRFVKDEQVAIDVIKDLAHRGLLFKKEKYEHSYPHCWRCKTPLIYYARDSWYIKMSSLKDDLVSQNKNINWEPNYIKDGRFGEWLKDIKDWAISRERYWGTPLPLWVSEDKDILAIGSFDELKKYTKRSGNKYFVMRHGQAENNILGILNADINKPMHLTEVGKNQVKEASLKFKDINFDYVFSSPLTRTMETTEILLNEVNSKTLVKIDSRIHEFNAGIFEDKLASEYKKTFKSELDEFTTAALNGECLNDVKKRVGEFLYELESNYKDKNILIVSHGDPIWMMNVITQGLNNQEAVDFANTSYPKNAEITELDFVPLPHNSNYELDVHRPYIDQIVLEKDGKVFTRVNEVCDVWFDSGCMPFAQDHYPFENKEKIESVGYPADYICEAIDQTRGWFYTLHAVGVLMERGNAYKNVICLGHILDSNGKKMSKSLGNIVDPWLMIEKYGVDTLRLWMYSVNQPGESKNFDEKTVGELHNKIFNLLYNVLTFYELYRDVSLEKENIKQSPNILDQWILSRLGQLTNTMTENLEAYRLLEPVRSLREFIDDLSTWYVRRSREMLKDGNVNSKQTLYVVLKTLARLMAPFAPFSAEDLWQKLKTENDVESVHLESWPKVDELSIENSIEMMREVREVVSLGLQARQKEGMQVKQPLKSITIPLYSFSTKTENSQDYFDILKEELNIKNIIVDESLKEEVKIDTHITEDLRKEGNYRELVRFLQDMRKKEGLLASDEIKLSLELGVNEQEIVNLFKNDLMKTVGIKELVIEENNGNEVKIEDLVFKALIIKV